MSEIQPVKGIRVEALRDGFYGGALRKRGDVFQIADVSDLGSWMTRVNHDRPLTIWKGGVRYAATQNGALLQDEEGRDRIRG